MHFQTARIVHFGTASDNMLSVTLNMIIQHYEEERNRESARAMESIQRLRELTTT